jgi:ribosome-binding factor A
MESSRQKKFARLIQKELGDVFVRHAVSVFEKAFITVGDVKMSPDLGLARVYLTFLQVPSVEVGLENVRKQTKFIRKELGNRIGKNVRIIPELEFYYDDTLDYAMKIDALLNKLNNPSTGDQTP